MAISQSLFFMDVVSGGGFKVRSAEVTVSGTGWSVCQIILFCCNKNERSEISRLESCTKSGVHGYSKGDLQNCCTPWTKIDFIGVCTGKNGLTTGAQQVRIII